MIVLSMEQRTKESSRILVETGAGQAARVMALRNDKVRSTECVQA